VTKVILGRLSRSDAAGLLVPDRSDEARAAAEQAATLRARLDVAADDYADGKIDRRQLERITARLRPQINAAQARSRTVDDSPLLAGLAGPDVSEVWAGLPLTRRRAVVDVLVTVTIHRAAQGARTFDPDAVKIEWRSVSS
jgi:site-specific DNA recombinase